MSKQHVPAIFSTDPSAIAAAESVKARIQAQFLMALNKRRDIDEARDRILRACRRPAFAERVEFSKPVAGRKIRGPSIRFAELALAEWGNIDESSQVIYEDEDIRRIRVAVLDLETNACFSKDIQVNKTVERKKNKGRQVVARRTNTQGEMVYIVKATEEELHNKESALISKAVRNEGLRLIPSDIKDEAIETAKETLRKRDAEDPEAARKKILDSFSAIGVRPKDLEQYLGHKTDSLTPAELEELRGIYRAIRDGDATWMEYVAQAQPKKEPAEDLEKKLQDAAGDNYDSAGEDTIDLGARTIGENGTDDPKGSGNAWFAFPKIDPELAATFIQLTGGIDAKTFWKLRETGMKQFFQKAATVLPGWPEKIQDIIEKKCKNMAKRRPQFLE